MTESEKRVNAKIPGPDTGITVRKTLCDICSPNFHCGLSCYLKDGKIIKIEGDQDNPISHGHICTKGAANREYLYHKDRIRTPLRRTGARGEGRFEPISWDEAYQEIARHMNETKARWGPEAVLCFGGYSKWYHPFLHRFAYSFGTPNFASDCSACYTATHIAWMTTSAAQTRFDLAHCKTFMGWAFNPYYSLGPNMELALKRKAEGVKFIIIDPRRTPATEQLADIHLRLRPGTDGILALGMGKILIDHDWIDHEFIEKYTYGFAAYKDYVQRFSLDEVSRVTGVPAENILRAAELYGTNGPAANNENPSSINHHYNGFQNYRAIIALQAITGNFDRTGGTIPGYFSFNHVIAGFPTREEQFLEEKLPQGVRPKIGLEDFPVWENENYLEAQGAELAKWIEGKKSYPVKTIFALGMNYRMFSESRRLLRAMSENLDFFVNADLFMTDTCKHADIVLPACTSFERETFHVRGGYLYFANRVIDPLYDSRSDLDILRDMARVLDLDDELLKGGYQACIDYIIQDTGYTSAELLAAGRPVKAKWTETYHDRMYVEEGLKTPTGKLEIYSRRIERYQKRNPFLQPLPTWTTDIREGGGEEYPFLLASAGRLPGTFHSRLMRIPSLRSLRPEPMADMNAQDAAHMGIAPGDFIEISTSAGSLRVRANPSITILPGVVELYHGYAEADVNRIIPLDASDPYTGFACNRGIRCALRKV